MKTCIRFMVYNAYGIGGTVKTVFNFADYFQMTGKYEVEIISMKRTGERPTLKGNPNVRIRVIQDARRGAKYSDEERELLSMPSRLLHPEEDLYPMFNAYTDRRLKEVLGGIHEGVIVATMPSFNVMIADLVDDGVLKIGQEHKSFADHTPGIQKMIRENYGRLDALTILTNSNKHIYERKIRGELPVYVLGNGTERLRFRANLKNHVIVAAGRYAGVKGYDMLILAFARIAAQFPDWVVKIYGNGTLAGEYVSLIKECGLTGRVLLEPGSEKLNEHFSEASMQVSSSRFESFGMAIIEGFAMGLPCISFACDGPREIITDGYDGILVPQNNMEKLADAMAKLMSDEEYRFLLGKNAYETSKKYELREIGGRFEKLVAEELAKKKRKLSEAPPAPAAAGTVQAAAAYRQPDIQADIPFAAYDSMVQAASEGKIGIRTIGRMVRGWLHFKLS